MPPPREIPGFYYDEAKRKYFRIEDSKKTVLPDGAAAWRSEGEVKRRRKEVEKEKGEREWKERVRRERVRRVDVGWGLGREGGLDGCSKGDGIVKEWAGGLEDKGKIRMWENLGEGYEGMMDCLFVFGVGGEEEERRRWGRGRGKDEEGEEFMWAYAGMDQMGVSVSAAPLDRGGRVNYDCNQVRRCRWPGRYVEWEHCQRYTNTVGIKGKKGSSEELLLLFGNHLDSTTPEAGYNYGVCPWKEGDGPYFEGNHEPRLRNNYINAGEWLPWNDGVSFVLGTQRGVYWPHAPALTEMDTRRRPKKHVPPFRGDVLAVDFLRAQPQVVLAGTRSGHICQLDTRTAPEEWDRMVFRHKSSVAQLRSIGGFDVLAAGPRSAMCIYDLRFAKAREQNANEKPFLPWERNAVAPAVEFPGYRNEAHIKIGLDVLSQPGYGHGVVAAAHDDCTVGLYSLRDGSRIPSADVDKIKAPGVVKALMFQTLPHDQHPSLFVGVGSVIQKFSY